MSALIGHGDYYNHAIFNLDEINGACKRLTKNGVIEFKNGRVYYTRLAKKVISKTRFKSGTQDSRISLIHSALNTYSDNVIKNESALECPIITEDQYQQACKDYTDQFKKLNEKSNKK